MSVASRHAVAGQPASQCVSGRLERDPSDLSLIADATSSGPCSWHRAARRHARYLSSENEELVRARGTAWTSRKAMLAMLFWSHGTKHGRATCGIPLVSVVMPVRNEERFILHSVGAVLSQDYSAYRMEVLIADGMSTDGTRDILEQLAARDPRLRIIDNPGRIVATGLNASIATARGDIIIRVDGHCEVAPDYVRRCVNHILEDDVDGVGGYVETIGQTYMARVIARAMSSTFGVGGVAFRTGGGRSLLADTIPFPAFRRDAMERAGQYDEEFIRNQDDEYNYRLRKLGAKLLLAADVRSRYFSRSTLRSLWRQYYEYGFWKVRVLQKHPHQMSARQFVPAAFLISLFGNGSAGLGSPGGEVSVPLRDGCICDRQHRFNSLDLSPRSCCDPSDAGGIRGTAFRIRPWLSQGTCAVSWALSRNVGLGHRTDLPPEPKRECDSPAHVNVMTEFCRWMSISTKAWQPVSARRASRRRTCQAAAQ